MISALALVVGCAGVALFVELGILILSLPFFLLLMAAASALIVLALLAVFERWVRESGDTSARPR